MWRAWWLLGFFALFLIAYPVSYMILSTSPHSLLDALKDGDVLNSIGLSLTASSLAALVSLVLGTPISYILARKNFPGKKLVEGILDMPMVIPHPVIGIAILAAFGRDTAIGKALYTLGLKIMGSLFGIVTVMTFVGLPFYINAVKNAFLKVPERLEKVSRSLGASPLRTFFSITLPLSLRSIVSGLLMCSARAISEFGAVVIVAYHPMVAPVLIFERFETFGLKASKPISVLLILICLVIFLVVRALVENGKGRGA